MLRGRGCAGDCAPDGGAETGLVGWSGVSGAWMEEAARDHGRGGMRPGGRHHGGALAAGAGQAGPWARERRAALLEPKTWPLRRLIWARAWGRVEGRVVLAHGVGCVVYQIV